jgi:SnoaL-like domain
MTTTDLTDLADRCLGMWNETDDARRKALIARTWTETALYLDPLQRGEGHAGIDAMVRAVQARFPGLRFRRAGAVDGFQDRLRVAWEFGPEGGPPVASGLDVGIVAADGRLQAVTGFIDPAPAAPGQAQ